MTVFNSVFPCQAGYFFVISAAVIFVKLSYPLSWLALWDTSRGCIGAFAKLRNATVSFVMSVCPHGTTRHPLDGFSLNLILEDFSKISQENSSLIKIGQV
jgi:hypothetical protein